MSSHTLVSYVLNNDFSLAGTPSNWNGSHHNSQINFLFLGEKLLLESTNIQSHGKLHQSFNTPSLLLISHLCHVVKGVIGFCSAYLLLLRFCGQVFWGLMVGNTTASKLQLAHPCRKQCGRRILVLGLDGIWHLSPNSDCYMVSPRDLLSRQISVPLNMSAPEKWNRK